MVTYRINELFIDPALTLIVVEAVEFRTIRSATASYAYANIVPTAVVMCREGGVTAWDMRSRPASVEQLRREIPELDYELTHVRSCAEKGLHRKANT